MEWYYYLIFGWLAFISLASIIITIVDKSKAQREKWRVPEATLLIFSTLGGSVAMLLTMLIIRHKTKHVKFMLGIPIIILLQVAAVYIIFRYFA